MDTIGFRRGWIAALLAITGALVLVAASSGRSAAAKPSAHAAASVIKIGLVTDETGPLAPDFGDVPQDFLARIRYQNAIGGVDGYKLEGIVEDDASTPNGNLAAVQKLVADGVAVIDQESGGGEPGSAAYERSKGIPVVGGPYSGPDWNTYKNMFSDLGRTYPATQAFTTEGIIFKDIGVKSVCSVGFQAIPSSYHGTLNTAASARAVGLKTPLVATTVQLGAPTTTQALQIKNARCDGVYAPLGVPGDVSLVEGAEQDGASHLRIDVESGAYGTAGNSSAEATLNGSAFSLYFLPGNYGTKLANATNALVHKYGGAPGRRYYDFDLFGWLGANLAIRAVYLAHSTNHAALIRTLTNLKGYNGDGLLPAVASFSHPVTPGDLSVNGCMFVEQLVNKAFKPMNHQRPICGKPIH